MRKLTYFIIIGMFALTGYIVIKRPGMGISSFETGAKASIRNNSISYVFNDVLVKREGEIFNVIPGFRFEKDDILITGKNSFAVISFFSESKLKLLENSHLKVERTPSKRRKGHRDILGLELLKGEIFVDFYNPDGKKRLDIFSEVLNLSVIGTQFYFSYDKKNNEATVAVDEGTVKVIERSLKQTEFLIELHGMKVKKGGEGFVAKTYPWVEKLPWDNYFVSLDDFGIAGKREMDRPKVVKNRKTIESDRVIYRDRGAKKEKASAVTKTFQKAKARTLGLFKKLPFYGDKVSDLTDSLEKVNREQVAKEKELDGVE